MAGPTAEPSLNFDAEFTINTIKNLTSNHEFEEVREGQAQYFDGSRLPQVPFSLSVKGVPFLRGRDTAYKAER